MLDLSEVNNHLSIRDIKQLHSLVLGDKPKHKGIFRCEDVYIFGSEVKPYNHFDIERSMNELVENYNTSNLHPLLRVAEFHVHFEHIHPFLDGNGRTGRLLINLELLKFNYLPINIKYADRDVYLSTLEQAQLTGDVTGFVLYFLEQQAKELEKGKTGSSKVYKFEDLRERLPGFDNSGVRCQKCGNID